MQEVTLKLATLYPCGVLVHTEISVLPQGLLRHSALLRRKVTLKITYLLSQGVRDYFVNFCVLNCVFSNVIVHIMFDREPLH